MLRHLAPESEGSRRPVRPRGADRQPAGDGLSLPGRPGGLDLARLRQRRRARADRLSAPMNCWRASGGPTPIYIVPWTVAPSRRAVESAVAAGQSFTIEYRIRDRAGPPKQVGARPAAARRRAPPPCSRASSPTSRRCAPRRARPARADQGARAALRGLVDRRRRDHARRGRWQIADRIPRGYSYPPEVAARIQLGDRLYTSPRLPPTR